MPRTLSDHYRLGMRRLIASVGYEEPGLDRLLVLHHRLVENIDNTLAYGDLPAFRGERVQILQQCSQLSLSLTGSTFASLCELPDGVVLQGAASLQDAEAERGVQDRVDGYLHEMRDMLLRRGLLFSVPGDDIREAVRALTLTVLAELDGHRRGQVVRFLHGTELIFSNNTVVSLRDAPLGRASLEGARLSWANLAGTDLLEANLAWANLAWANLEGASLVGANLFMADLGKARLLGADLHEANLLSCTLEKAEYDAQTRWPAGFDPAARGALLRT